MTPTTPSGCQVSISRWPGRSDGIVRPSSWRDSPTAKSQMSIISCTSPSASERILPTSMRDQVGDVGLVLGQQLAQALHQRAAHGRGHHAPCVERLAAPPRRPPATSVAVGRRRPSNRSSPVIGVRAVTDGDGASSSCRPRNAAARRGPACVAPRWSWSSASSGLLRRCWPRARAPLREALGAQGRDVDERLAAEDEVADDLAGAGARQKPCPEKPVAYRKRPTSGASPMSALASGVFSYSPAQPLRDREVREPGRAASERPRRSGPIQVGASELEPGRLVGVRHAEQQPGARAVEVEGAG